MAARKITCPTCGQSEEGFTLVHAIRVTTDLDAHGQPEGGSEYANELQGRSLNCRGCGRSWTTTRYFAIAVDVR